MDHIPQPSDAPRPPLAEPHGNGLRLRAWEAARDDHARDWLRGVNDPEFRHWNTPLQDITDLDGARESLRGREQAAADGTGVGFRVTDEESGTTLGHVGVNAISLTFRTGRVGYWVLPEARGRGVAVRALALAAHWALTDLGLHRLELGHALGHDASCRIAERCGFPAEGIMRGAMWEAGRRDAFRDVHLHARLATDPAPGTP
ncbi:GNAT family N-acetyltransferase [Streptomyces sp. MS06]|uniref:GNAT family N-acetyltransferase n=1 Tax=Streptomyces sp. MS06 TaxID=3385974 RepID=UPI0039A0E1F1